MIIVVIFLIMFLSNSTIAAVVVSANKIELLPYCKHTLLEAGRYNVEEIVKFPEKQWTKSTRKNLSLGFKNDKELWIQCKLINDKDRAQKIVLETDNPNTNYINMYLFKEEGVVAQRAYKKVNYYFDMELEPKESKVVYLKFYSPISTLKAYPVLWTPNTFLNHIENRGYAIGLFFGAMGALLIYNLFILIFTKDITYLWYCSYLAGILLLQAFYIGILDMTALPSWLNARIFINLIIALPIAFAFLFSRSFLNMPQNMPNLDRLFKHMTLFVIAVSIIPYPNIVIVIYTLSIATILFAALYALKLKLPQSKYYAAGWGIIALATILMGLIGLGFLPSLANLAYIPQLSFAFEAMIFSIGLASRINTLKAQKEEADRKLLYFHKKEKERLQQLVSFRTLELSEALNEKNTLLKEINHRVKNNLQTIVSLLQLQISKIDNIDTKEMLLSAQNRINSMSKLHELLYHKETIVQIDTELYFRLIVKEITIGYPSSNLEFIYDISVKLKPERALYCGLIVNELVTNSLKYAFDNRGGKVMIALKKSENIYTLSVSDDGKGIKEGTKKRSIGLKLVKALAKQQLKGDLKIDTSSGTKILITFSD